MKAAALLSFHPSKGARILRKVIVSAIANAEENSGIPRTNLRVRSIAVDEGPHMKRITQKAMGRGNRITKKTSHITVVLEPYEPAAPVKPHGTKAKTRPKFETPRKGKAPVAAPAEEVVTAAPETPVEEPITEAAEPVAEAAVAETPSPEEPAAEAPAEVPSPEPATEAAPEETAGEPEEKKD